MALEAIIAGATLALGATSTVIGVMGQRQTAEANVATANYQAQVAANNQAVAEQNARYATQAGQTNAQSQDFRTRALIGSEMAGQGASGIDLTSGSPSDVVNSTRQLGRLDTANVLQQSNLTAYGYRNQATGFGAESELLRKQAGYAGTAGMIGSAGTILGGATSLASKWLQYQNTGVFPGGAPTAGGGGAGGAYGGGLPFGSGGA